MKEVISASRRTDMPAYYLDRLTGFIKQRFAEVRNPYSGKKYIVSLKPEDVHTLVLWSKNFKHLLENPLYLPMMTTSKTLMGKSISKLAFCCR